MVVLPAASRPTIKIRISFLPKRFRNRSPNTFPIAENLNFERNYHNNIIQFYIFWKIIQEISIKIAKIYSIKKDSIDIDLFIKYFENKFFFPGETLLDQIQLKTIIFTEINVDEKYVNLILRPVLIYQVSKPKFYKPKLKLHYYQMQSPESFDIQCFSQAEKVPFPWKLKKKFKFVLKLPLDNFHNVKCMFS